MGFYGLNLASYLIIFLIALLLFGPKYLHTILKDLNASLRYLTKYLSRRDKKQLDDDKPQVEKRYYWWMMTGYFCMY